MVAFMTILDSIKRYQRHRTFELILQNINFHLHVILVITLLVIFLNGFTIAMIIFLCCIFVSLIYNIYLYRNRRDNYQEAATYLDRELNGQDMFLTLLEHPSSSDNLMLKLLHARAENSSRKILEKDFDKQDKTLLNETLFRLLVICVVFSLLFLILRSLNSELIDENLKYDQNNQIEKTKFPGPVDKKNNSQNISAVQKTNSGNLKTKSRGMNSATSESESHKAGSSSGSNTKKSGKQSPKSDRIEPLNYKTGNLDNKAKEGSSANPNKSRESGQSKMKKNIDSDISSSMKSRNSRERKIKSIQNTDVLKSDALKKPKRTKKQVGKKVKPTAKFDSRVSGDLGGQKSLEQVKFKDQKDIENTMYKKQKDELEQVLNNPRMPKSYKTILKRFYSSEKK